MQLLLARNVRNVWPLCSKSACSQVSVALFYVWTVWVWICTGDMQASCLQVKGGRCYLSQNIGLAVAGSARPAPPLVVEGTQLTNTNHICVSGGKMAQDVGMV